MNARATCRRVSTAARVAGAAICLAVLTGCSAGSTTSDEPIDGIIDDQLRPRAQPKEMREGLAAAILIDVSGSMARTVASESGTSEAKIEIARRAARDLIDQFARYATDHAGEAVMVGVYEFSHRDGEADCRTIVPMAVPDRAQAESALGRLRAEGDTPIGNAMITAKHALDSTGLTRRHLLVITDGENTVGPAPGPVALGIGRRPEAERPSIYFVAFDIAAGYFAEVQDAGGLVLAATNARELNDTLDSLLRGKILVEK